MENFSFLLIFALFHVCCGYPVSLAPEVEQNLLNFSLGINYKFNGKLNHNVDRVWLVTKFKLPKIEELYFLHLSLMGIAQD